MPSLLKSAAILLPYATSVAAQFQPTSYALKVAVGAWCDDAFAAEATYGHISEWDVSRVRDMTGLFKSTAEGGHCSSSATFNADISCWNTGNLRNMFDTFAGCSSFNQPIIGWSTGKVTNMGGTFSGTTVFNQPLAWDISRVTELEGAFEGSAFNQEIISAWNIQSVLTLNSMFYGATSFDQVLCWDVEKRDTSFMFTDSMGELAPTGAKCVCMSTATYWDGSACSSCPAGTFSMGKSDMCFTCPVGQRVTADQSSCECIPDPSPQPTPQATGTPRPTPDPSFDPTPFPYPYPTTGPTPHPVGEKSVAAPTSSPVVAPAPGGMPGVCFHGDGLVTLESGELRALSEVEIGDNILSADEKGNFSFSPVLSLPHNKNSELVVFLELTTEKGKRLNLTPDHLLPRCGGEVVTARAFAVGDCILTVDGQESIKRITSAHKAGVYTAIAENKFIVVDQVVASPFGQDRDTERAYQVQQRQNQRRLERQRLRRTGSESASKKSRV